MPRSSNSLRKSRASDKVRSFSNILGAKTAPLSSPPWLGSINTKNSGAGGLPVAAGVGDGVAGGAAAVAGPDDAI